MKIFFLLSLLLLSLCGFSQRMVFPNSGAMESTCQLFTTAGSGTSFIVRFERHMYLVTAKHMFPGAKSGELVNYSAEVPSKGRFAGHNRIFFHDSAQVDVAVLDLEATNDDTLGTFFIRWPQDRSTFLGDEVLFLGYPLGLKTISDSLTYPLVKRGVFSGSIKTHGIRLVLLDGHNNHGFSGAPVIAFPETGDPARGQYLMGVISAYYVESQTAKTKVGGDEVQFDENSGIIIVYPINYIVEIIRKIR